MRITLGTTQYRWTPGTRTINVWTDTPYTSEQAGWPLSRWLETDVISFGYDKPDNTTTAIDALDAILTRLVDDGYEVLGLDVNAVLHADYPHEPGYLYGCPACESRCHCTRNSSECVYGGDHRLFVDLCADCIAFDANGTVGDDPDYTPDKPPMALLAGYLIGPDDTDHECEGHFSWGSCDGCGTALGGTRYCYMAVKK